MHLNLQIWLVGDECNETEQKKASKGTLFIPFTQFPPKKLRKDCFYRSTPAMVAPPSLVNVHSCEVSGYTSFFVSFDEITNKHHSHTIT